MRGKVGNRLVWIFSIAAVIMSLAACGKSLERQIAEQLELGQKYLLEMDYEQAIVVFQKVIQLDEKNVEAYLKLSEAYVATADYEQAVKILRQGVNQTQDSSLQDRLEIYEYVEESQSMLEELKEAMDDGSRQEIWDIQKEEEYQELTSLLDEMLVQDSGDGNYLLIYPCGHCYYGEVEDGKRSGHGIWAAYEYAREQIEFYDGAWEDDYPNGEGDYWTICMRVPEDLFYHHASWKDGMEDGTVSYQVVSEFGNERYEYSFSYTAQDGVRIETADLHPDQKPEREEREMYCYYSTEERSYYAARDISYGIAHARKGYDDHKTGENVSLKELLKKKEEIEAKIQEDRIGRGAIVEDLVNEEEWSYTERGNKASRYQARFPRVSIGWSEEAEERINQYYERELYKARENKIELQQMAKDEWVVERIDEDDYEWYLDNTFEYDVLYNADGILSIRQTDSSYLGGVHGMTIWTVVSFDTNSGEKLTLSLLSDDEPALREFLAGRVIEAKEAQGSYNTLFRTSVTAESIQNYCFDENGIYIVYNPYEIASYAEGMQEFHISYDELAPYLNEYAMELFLH